MTNLDTSKGGVGARMVRTATAYDTAHTATAAADTGYPCTTCLLGLWINYIVLVFLCRQKACIQLAIDG